MSCAIYNRIKKSLCMIKKGTKAHKYIQHELPEHKAEYISSDLSTVILQHRGRTASQIPDGLRILLCHASGKRDTCPAESWCRWRNTTSSQPTPARTTSYTSEDISKVREVFATFDTEEFCKHLTLGMTQNAYESLHNSIWNFCPNPNTSRLKAYKSVPQLLLPSSTTAN